MNTVANKIDYDSSQPHDDPAIIQALRERLDVPRDWIALDHTGGGCMCIRVTLKGNLHEGDPLDCPTRYVYLTCDGPRAWMLGFYDNSLEGCDEGEAVTLMLRTPEPTAEEVANAVARILVRAAGLKQRRAVRLIGGGTCNECGVGIDAGEAFGMGETRVLCGACVEAEGIEVAS